MVRCEILVSSRYSDYNGGGTNRRAKFHREGEFVKFPYDYAKELEGMDMVEIMTTEILAEDAVIEIDEKAEDEAPSMPPPSESAIEYAADNDIDLNSGDVEGTGSGGRIVLADVRRYYNNRSVTADGEGVG